MTEDHLKFLLKEKQTRIEDALSSLLPPEDNAPAIVHEAMRYSVLAGGKRLRPLLCLTSCEAAGGDETLAMSFACALELIHTYSLIHDDLPCMDNDDFRRGRPTSHKVFGEAMAVLAGDALLTLAFEWMAREPRVNPEVKVKAIQEVANASGTHGLVGGQAADLTFQGKSVTTEELQGIHMNKTARLIEASVRVGAILAGASAETLQALAAYGQALGLAFQITDDILDVLGSASEMGKGVRKDASLAKATYPAIFGVEDSKKIASEILQKGLKAIEFLGDKGDLLREISRWTQARQN